MAYNRFRALLCAWRFGSGKCREFLYLKLSAKKVEADFL